MDRNGFDLLVIGGGINGTAIARDAARRGASVLLVERDDLASWTSSASSKLIHGGLRYLEYYEFRLVREALRERAILLRTAPHIVRPLEFALPQAPGMRPWWMLRAGLLLYDLFALGGGLPRARVAGGRDDAFRAPLKDRAVRLARYWDAWVDDARLVALNALDAAEHGAEIATRTALLGAQAENGRWRATLSDGRTIDAGIIVNAAGGWVAELLARLDGRRGNHAGVRLVKGSHIVLPRLHEGAHAYILQQPDGRVVFALPYGDHSLVGTTDIPVQAPEDARIADEEIDYLCAAVNRYFERQSRPEDVVWRYSGIRALYDDGEADAKAVTRDYRLERDTIEGATLLSVFGGKITTARALAEETVDSIGIAGDSTAHACLPGGDIGPAFDAWLATRTGWMPAALRDRLARAYGTRLKALLGDAAGEADMGRHFGAGLYEIEVRYLIAHEFARSADDILWRRTKLGLAMREAERGALADWIAAH